MNATFDFTGKVVVVTGGSRGLGLAMVEGFAKAGATVAIASRKLDACEEVARSIRDRGGKASAHQMHAGRWEDCDRLFEEVKRDWGGADILINNAGMSPIAPSSVETSEELFDKIISVNMKGPFRLCSLFGADMVRRGGGCIINISSTGSLRPEFGAAPYDAAKSGVNIFTTTFAQEYGPTVRVNAIAPGPFHTDVSKAWSRSEAFTRHAKKSIPLGRAGDPPEIVGAALYLASDIATYTSGAMIVVDGGQSVGMMPGAFSD